MSWIRYVLGLVALSLAVSFIAYISEMSRFDRVIFGCGVGLIYALLFAHRIERKP